MQRLPAGKDKKLDAGLQQKLVKCVDHVKNKSVESSLNIFRQQPRLSPKRIPFKIMLSSAETEKAISMGSAATKFFTAIGQKKD